ncbi:hypothetical protein Drorol1_Dr00024912, partial [Drosera rotundifolia]
PPSSISDRLSPLSSPRSPRLSDKAGDFPLPIYMLAILLCFVAIPIVPPIRVIVSFTKFEVLEPSEQFSIPPSRPTHSRDHLSSLKIGLLCLIGFVGWFKVLNLLMRLK